MPIPGVPTLEPVDKPMMSPAEAGKPGEAISNLGQASNDAALTGLDLDYHIKQAQKSVDGLAAQNDYAAADARYQEALAKTTNSRDVDAVTAQARSELNDIAKQWSNSPASVDIQMYGDSLLPKVDHLGVVKTIDLQSKEGAVQSEIQLQTLLPQLVTATRNNDKAQADYINGYINHMYDDLNKKGLMSDADKEIALNKVQIQYRQQLNQSYISSADPKERTAAIAQLNGTDSTKYPSGAGYPEPDVPGNIQWYGRPNVDTNAIKKGTTGTVLSTSREEDDMEVLVPRIYDGAVHSEDEAWQHYKDTGQHMGKFGGDENTRIDNANAYAQKYHEDAQAGKFNTPPSQSGPLNLAGLAPGDVAALREDAISTNEKLNNQQEAQNLNRNLNVVQNAFQAPAYKNNYEARVNSLTDGEWLQKNGIVTPDGQPDRVMAEKLIAETNRQRAEWEKERDDHDADVLPKIEDAIIGNSISRGQLVQLSQQEGLSPRGYSAALAKWDENNRYNHQVAVEGRELANQERTQKSADVFSDFSLRMAQGAVPTDHDILTAVGLTKADQNTLLERAQKVRKDPPYAGGMSIIANAYPLGANMTAEEKNAQNEAYNRTLAAYDQEINSHPEEDKSDIAAKLVMPGVIRNAILNSIPASLRPQQGTGIAGWFSRGYNSQYQTPRTDTAPSAEAPKVGDIKKYPNGKTGVWDGTGYVAQ